MPLLKQRNKDLNNNAAPLFIFPVIQWSGAFTPDAMFVLHVAITDKVDARG